MYENREQKKDQRADDTASHWSTRPTILNSATLLYGSRGLYFSYLRACWMCLIYNTAPPECRSMYVLNTCICFKYIQAAACLWTPLSLFILGGHWVCLIYSLGPPGCVFTWVRHHPTPPLVWKELIKHTHTLSNSDLQQAQFDLSGWTNCSPQTFLILCWNTTFSAEISLQHHSDRIHLKIPETWAGLLLKFKTGEWELLQMQHLNAVSVNIHSCFHFLWVLPVKVFF